MSIVRGPRPDSEFYILDKSISEDPRLGWGARGLLIFLLGKPDHWEVSIAHLVKQTENAGRRSGRDQIYGFLKELELAGYIHKRPKRGEAGAFAGTEYVVTEQPRYTENPDPVPLPENPEPAQPPLTDLPDPDKPLPANPTQVSNESLVRTEVEQETTSRDQFVEEGFEIFYSAGLVKKSKQAAFKAWKRTVKGKADPVAFARELAADIRQRLEYQQMGFDKLHPSTYLNGQRWEDELVDERLFPAQKNPQGGNPAGNKRDQQVTPRPGESVADESLYGKNYAQGATTDEQLPDYLRH